MSSGIRLGVLDVDVEVAVFVENAGNDDLVLGLGACRAPVLLRPARRTGNAPADICRASARSVCVGNRVQIVVEFLDVLAVITLSVGEAEQALFQYRIPAVPQREGDAKTLVGIAEATDAVLAPAISAARACS